MQVIFEDKFYRDGRGPEVKKINYNQDGTKIIAIDYYNPNDEYIPENIKHLFFVNPQAFMITPEEEYNYKINVEHLENQKGAIFDFGQSKWYKTFTRRHSQKSHHYSLMFYDEIIDIIRV